ncbi:LysR family transcriptional regulator [Caballeronia novacaledonica]|uniref:LysR family transcriptional regulator n=2 Tax=Caballeronia novacaledonica TaxID=1544861 RepID=A0AA37MJ07_9BURK|nr:LysR family transcriptional regulator [Caballeronia novacaledonica]
MTQPAATKLIQEIEEMFAANLFRRGKFGMEPTIFGSALLRYVRRVLADLGEAKAHVELLKHGELGTLRIGVISFSPASKIVAACSALREVHPQVSVSIVEGSSESLIAQLRRGELDMTLARVVSRNEIEDLDVQPIYDEPFSAVARRENGYQTAQMSWELLAQQDWVLPTKGALSRLAVDLAFVREGFMGPRVVVECQSLEQIRRHVMSAGLFGVLPSSEAVRAEAEGTLVVVRHDFAPHVAPISLLSLKGREMAKEALEFVEALRGNPPPPVNDPTDP